jgi:hypothetical protein
MLCISECPWWYFRGFHALDDLEATEDDDHAFTRWSRVAERS